MLTLPSGIAAHVDDPVVNAGHLIELQGTTPHYFTDLPFDVTWNGHTWVHTMPFALGQIVTDAEGVQDVSVTFDNQAQQLSGYDATEGMADRVMRVHEVWVDPTINPPTVYTNGVMQDVANGTTSGLDFDETEPASTGVLSLGSSSALTGQNGPRNEYDLSCQNGFGDLRCKEVPAQTTVAAALAATGSQTVTPAAMTNILVGLSLSVTNADGTAGEIVVVTAITGTTFTASFVSTKTAGWTVRGLCMRTYANCQLYTNTPNFRGCRHALPVGTVVPWGQAGFTLGNRQQYQ